MESVMKNYSIMPLDMEHIDEICEDIKNQVKNGVATMPLFVIKLVPEGVPPIDKATLQCEKYKIYRDRLNEMGIENGVLIQCTIGHDYVLNQMFGFEQYVNLTDGDKRNVVCPYDKDFQEYIKNQFATVASFAPAMIMVDDDFRLIFRQGKGCACKLHISAVEKRLGEKTSRTELLDRLINENKDGKYTKAFIETQRDSLLQSAKAMREGINSVDESIPGSFCCCGPDAEFAADIAKIISGKNNPVIVRLNNGNYTPLGMKKFSWKASQRAALSVELLRDKVDYILAETDTCPQNRYSTSAAFLHAHFTASLIEGAKGAKHWITRLFEFEPESGLAYRKKLAENFGFYNEISKLSLQLKWKGCRIPTYKKSEYSYKTMGFYTSNTWGYNVLERLGLPLYYSSNNDGTAFIDENICHRYNNLEMLEMLKGNCVLTGLAAAEFEKAGLSEYLGIKTEEWNGNKPSFEVVSASKKRVPIQQKMLKLIPLNDDVVIHSTVYHLHNGTDEIPLFPGCTVYKNSLGGRITVFAGTSDTDYHYGTAFSFLNQTRKKQFIDILSENGNLEVYYPGDAELFLKIADTPDGDLFCAIFNLGFDELEQIPLITQKEITAAYKLMPDGSRKKCDFNVSGNTVYIDTALKTPEPVVLFLK